MQSHPCAWRPFKKILKSSVSMLVLFQKLWAEEARSPCWFPQISRNAQKYRTSAGSQPATRTLSPTVAFATDRHCTRMSSFLMPGISSATRLHGVHSPRWDSLHLTRKRETKAAVPSE